MALFAFFLSFFSQSAKQSSGSESLSEYVITLYYDERAQKAKRCQVIPFFFSFVLFLTRFSHHSLRIKMITPPFPYLMRSPLGRSTPSFSHFLSRLFPTAIVDRFKSMGPFFIFTSLTSLLLMSSVQSEVMGQSAPLPRPFIAHPSNHSNHSLTPSRCKRSLARMRANRAPTSKLLH